MSIYVSVISVLCHQYMRCAYSTTSTHLKVHQRILLTVLFQENYHLFSKLVELVEDCGL